MPNNRPSSSSATNRYSLELRKIKSKTKQNPWFRHSMPPSIDSDFESIEHYQLPNNTTSEDSSDSPTSPQRRQLQPLPPLPSQLAPPAPPMPHHHHYYHHQPLNLRHPQQNVPIKVHARILSRNSSGTLQCHQRKESKTSIFSKQSGKSTKSGTSKTSSVFNITSLKITSSFLRKKRKEYEGKDYLTYGHLCFLLVWFFKGGYFG